MSNRNKVPYFFPIYVENKSYYKLRKLGRKLEIPEHSNKEHGHIEQILENGKFLFIR